MLFLVQKSAMTKCGEECVLATYPPYPPILFAFTLVHAHKHTQYILHPQFEYPNCSEHRAYVTSEAMYSVHTHSGIVHIFHGFSIQVSEFSNFFRTTFAFSRTKFHFHQMRLLSLLLLYAREARSFHNGKWKMDAV